MELDVDSKTEAGVAALNEIEAATNEAVRAGVAYNWQVILWDVSSH